MNSRFKFVTLGAAALLVAGFSSCKSDKSNSTDTADTIVEEVIDDSLEAPADTAYLGSFFDNAANKSTTPSDSTYMETATGIKYVVVKDGTGASPKASDSVTVHYTGKLTDGTVFDSSISRGEPATFPLTQVIPGWTEGLQLMKTGGKTIFYIPSNLGYGEQGVPGTIPPNSPLIFEVELLSIN